MNNFDTGSQGIEDTIDDKDELRHECGIAAVVLTDPTAASRVDVKAEIVRLLEGNQNRGQHSAGASFLSPVGITTEKGLGKVIDVFGAPIAIFENGPVLRSEDLHNYTYGSYVSPVSRRYAFADLKDICRDSVDYDSAVSMAIGNIRWATAGSASIGEAQPFSDEVAAAGFGHGNIDESQPLTNELQRQRFSIGFNGHIQNYKKLRREFESKTNPNTGRAYEFRTDVDTELLTYLVVEAQAQGKNYQEMLGFLEERILGAFNIVLMFDNGDFIAYRDKHGFHPLAYAEYDGMVMFSSESAALKNPEIIDLEPGQAFVMSGEDRTHHTIRVVEPEPYICAFEHIYFGRIDSVIDGVPTLHMRKYLGEIAAYHAETRDFKNAQCTPVVPVPRSALESGKAYAETLGADYQELIVKKETAGRSYTATSQAHTDAILSGKFLLAENFPAKLALVDDTMIKGSTLQKLIYELGERGVKEIEIVITAPPVVGVCPYGVFIPADRLLANKFDLPENGTYSDVVLAEISEYLKGESKVEEVSIKFLHSDNVRAAFVKAGGDSHQICTGCMDREYPTKAGDHLDNDEYRET